MNTPDHRFSPPTTTATSIAPEITSVAARDSNDCCNTPSSERMVRAVGAPMATATQYGCLGCHGLEQGVVGPGFRQIADKYKADKGAEAALMTKIRTGGAGAWGSMAMPPQPGPKDDELKAVVGWILAGAPAQ